jgi:di/tricarboxylate transporter
LTTDQVLIVGLLVALVAILAVDRFRFEMVALVGLACGILLGLVPTDRAFAGLANPAVVTVVEVLLIVQALDSSCVVEVFGARLSARLGSPRRVLLGLCLLGAAVSTVMNNVGAFALVLPLAFSMARSAGMAPREVLMPLAFATLLGGLCTVIGTPANLVVSGALRVATGAGLGFLDFAPTGLPVALAGLAAILLWAPVARVEPRAGEAARARRIVTEARILRGTTVEALSARLDGAVHAIERDGRRVFPLRASTALGPGDVALLEADDAAFRATLAGGEIAAARSTGAGAASEAVVMPTSLLVGSRPATIEAFGEGVLRLVGVTTANPRIEGSLDALRIGIGDVLHLEGEAAALRGFIEESGLMAVGSVARAGGRSFRPLPIVVFALGILMAGIGVAPPEIAFGAVVLVLAVVGALDLRAALADLNWPIVLLLVAMLPLGEAVATTGAASSIAAAMAEVVPAGEPVAAAALMLGLAMLVTPFVNNATTAVILAPIAVELARAEGVTPELVLMAVAIGASSDFLTPFGHHNNTLAYGLGGYSFRDFPRLGWPVSVVAFVVGTGACVLVWG